MNYICQLCLTKCEEYIEIFSELGKEKNIATIISKYFWFEITEPGESWNTSSLIAIICTNCWFNLDEFHKFYRNIEMVHGKGHLILFPAIEEFDTKLPQPQRNTRNINNNNNNEKNEIDYDNQENEILNSTTAIQLHDDKYISKHDANLKLEDTKFDENKIPCVAADTTVMKNDRLVKKDHSKRRLFEQKITESNKSSRRKKYVQLPLDERLAIQNEKQERRSLNQEKCEQEAYEMRQYFDMKCDLCGKNCDSLMDSQQHYRSVHNTKGYLKCCGRKFFNRGMTLEHIKYHLNPDAYKCTTCFRTYIDKRGLKNHMEVHVPEESRQYKCDICTLSFAKQNKLSQHKRLRHHDKNIKNFICDLCNKAYSTKVILATHMRCVHLAAFRQVCDICAKVYNSKKVLDDHRAREHFNIVEPPVQCNICGSWLRHIQSLKKHIKRHSNIPQTCMHCGKIKPSQQALTQHIRSVHVSESHSCTICDKSFKKAISLKEHMASHTGESLYTCPYCPKTFNSGANMHSHRKKIHPIEWQDARLKRYHFQPS